VSGKVTRPLKKKLLIRKCGELVPVRERIARFSVNARCVVQKCYLVSTVTDAGLVYDSQHQRDELLYRYGSGDHADEISVAADIDQADTKTAVFCKRKDRDVPPVRRAGD